jgi:hypothetical protein
MNSLWISICCILFFVLIFAIRNSYTALDLFFVLLPFKTVQLDFGLMIWLFYLPWIYILIKNFRFIYFFNSNISIYFLFTVLVTILISLFDNENWYYKDGDFFRFKGRYIVSILKFFLFNISPILLLPKLIKKPSQIISSLTSYLTGIKILCFLGALQFCVYYLFGFDFLPYGLTKDNEVLSATEDLIFSNLGFLRISSLGGEPKGFAVSLVIGITMFVLANIANIEIKNSRIWLFFMFIVFIFTLSTSGYILILLPLSFLFFTSLYNFHKNSFKKALALIILIFLISFSWDFIYTILEARVFSRQSQLLTEDIDESVIDFLFSQPIYLFFGTGLGNIHQYSIKFISDNYLFNLRLGEVFVSRYGYLKIISESGIIGFILFLFFNLVLFMSLIRIKHIKYRRVLILGFFSIFIFYMVRSGYCEIEYFFFIGLLISFLNLRRVTKTL